ncbi:MmgE/PrpD family protein [Paraburkholderia sp. Ac-20336]|uniref:MmgE/PrpD family protein n=1 Tax=Burkholderiaceae TaxID=119060 RepID=UPI0014221E87|nr:MULTISPECIES: MmgE/PrpD family protein [Burkholderiaceae]MBN3801523.1 MmgE/PrpD family protein [Paraburkholderia sp. Ac-20336]NIF55723.1 MmgE/PrpD family protein [Burkholderia sp. Ax-1724]NIF78046.1 MmgE/PrpD family protein [Paraburkholderia sp. Cy-641]
MSMASSLATRDTRVTEALAAWTAALRFEAIPADVVAHAKLCLIDALGCGLYGARQPWGVMAAETASAFGGRDATLFGSASRASAPDAALANGTAIHGFEVDDVHVTSSLHPGSVTIPAVLATAELRRASGAQLLTAVITGYEAGIRVGICAGLTHSTSGYHVTGTVGTLASSAAVAHVLALDARATLHALAIGATQAAGLYAARMGAMAKRFHAGRAAQSGVIAAYLAQRGFTGSDVAIEAPFGGFMSTLRGQFDPATIVDGLGERWETKQVGFKVYAACASAHTTVDALDALMKRGLTAERLARLRIGLSKKGFTNIGWPYTPTEVVSAQMSGYYTAAVKLLDGDAFVDQYRPERIADPTVLALIDKIEIYHDQALDAGGAEKRHTAQVSAQLVDGSEMNVRIEHRLGSAQRPLGADVIRAKFVRLAASALGAQAAHRILAFVDDIEGADDLSPLFSMLSAISNG